MARMLTEAKHPFSHTGLNFNELIVLTFLASYNNIKAWIPNNLKWGWKGVHILQYNNFKNTKSAYAFVLTIDQSEVVSNQRSEAVFSTKSITILGLADDCGCQ